MRTIQMNRWTAEKFQQLLHCGCSNLECDCRKIPQKLVTTWARIKLMCDRMGHGGRNFSDEAIALMVAVSGCRDDIAADIEVEIDGAEILEHKKPEVPAPPQPKRRGRPPKKRPALVQA